MTTSRRGATKARAARGRTIVHLAGLLHIDDRRGGAPTGDGAERAAGDGAAGTFASARAGAERIASELRSRPLGPCLEAGWLAAGAEVADLGLRTALDRRRVAEEAAAAGRIDGSFHRLKDRSHSLGGTHLLVHEVAPSLPPRYRPFTGCDSRSTGVFGGMARRRRRTDRSARRMDG
jgi:hypothetical protein